MTKQLGNTLNGDAAYIYRVFAPIYSVFMPISFFTVKRADVVMHLKAFSILLDTRCCLADDVNFVYKNMILKDKGILVMWIRFVMIAAVLSFFGLSSASASPSVKASPSSDSFGKIDADADKGISLKEFMQARPNMREKAFEVIDTDADGSINRSEWDAFYATHKTDSAASMSQSKIAKNPPLEKKAGDTKPLLIQPPKQ